MLSSLEHSVVVERPADYFGEDMYFKLVDELRDRMVLNGLECAIRLNQAPNRVSADTDAALLRLVLQSLRTRSAFLPVPESGWPPAFPTCVQG